MTSAQVSGGDVYVKNFATAARNPFNIVLDGHAKELAKTVDYTAIGPSDTKSAGSGLGITWLYIKRALRSTWYVRRSHQHYDISVAASPFVCDVLPVALARSGTRAVILFHLLPEREAHGWGTKLRFLMARFEQAVMLTIIRHRFDTILVGNNELQARMKKKFPKKHIYVAHAGIDTSKIDQAPKAKKDPNLGVFVGRLTTQKGILDLPTIIQQIQQIQPKFKMKIIGDGPDRPLLESEIKKHAITGIEVLGFVDSDTKYKLMKQAQFFIFPSYEEGWGIALAEAMYTGCNCVCYELDHYEGIFKKYPIYVELGNAPALADAVTTNYKRKVISGQIAFAGSYDSQKVVQDVLKKIGLL